MNLAEKKAKLKYGGTEKISNRKLYKLKYFPRHGSDLEITLFFDAETFRHMRTEYERVVPASLGTGGIDSSPKQRGARVKIVEEFSDFKPEGRLNLPHSYNLRLFIDSGSGTTVSNWSAKLTQFMFNQPIDAGSFNVESYAETGDKR